ncbi:MAG: FAD-dependent oxidoreductase [Burkholderiales bacterium]|nr:FAD-dependent oxidoreductase [Burkholderiales bacterium]
MTSPRATACDVLVVGSGAGGMSAAVAAAKLGLDVVLIEKEPYLGGTTAVSGGWLWIPCNPLALRAGVADTIDQARTYLRHELGDRYDEPRVEAYLATGPRMVEFFERETALRFFLGRDYPDYHPDAPGGLAGGRAICASPYDGRELHEALGQIKPPPRELTLFGIKVGSGPDFRHFANAQRSLGSALYVGKRVATHALHRIAYGRDATLMSGGALIGRLVKSALDLGVRLWRSTKTTELIVADGRVAGALAMRGELPIRIAARRGVVLAAGGFPHDSLRRQRLFRQSGGSGECYSLASGGNTGDGLAMAERAGAAVEENYANAAAWMPVSRVPYRDGSFGVYPHTFDRGKPGFIIVDAAGKRFVNEGNAYHDVGEAMLRAATPPDFSAFLVCDHAAIRRYGLGMAKPFPLPLAPYLRSGYLKRGRTLAALAREAGIDARGLSETIARFNGPAKEGRDPDFGRGANAYNVYQGDSAATPGPCLAPIARPPFYAVKIYPGDLGTFDGLRTDANARVLDAGGAPIPGLYAAGTDMASIFAGCYPGPGINLGPAMTFGYIAARHLAAPADRA